MVLALLLIVAQAPELAFVHDAAYVDIVVALIAALASSYLVVAGDYVRVTRDLLLMAHAALLRSHLGRPAGYAYSAIAVSVALLVPGCRSALIAAWLPAIFSTPHVL